MAEPSGPDATDSGNRATIAQTLAEVRGLRDLFKAEITSVQRQLDGVTGLDVIVAELKAQNKDQEKRISTLEHAESSGAEWRRTHLPALVIAALSLMATVVFILIQLK